LEGFYGARLLQRNHRDVTLTKAGESLRDVVEHFLERLAAVGRSLRSQQAHRLSLSAPPSFVARWLMPRLGAFLGSHPEVDFKLHATTDLIDIDTGETDVAIRYGNGNWPGLHSEKLWDEEVFPVASPTWIERLDIRGLDDLGKGVLLRDDFSCWNDWQKRAGAITVVDATGPVYSDSSLLLQAAETGQGVALGRSVLVEDALAGGRLVRIGSHSMKVQGSYFLVRSLATPATPAMESFREWLISIAHS
jgi:LysR family glycine cleavage system transcriptional activator